MSQPVGIIAKIQLSEDNYKTYVRKSAGKLLAENIFDCIKNQHSNYYVFRYLKKENALYAFLYFNYGNGPFLLEHPLLAMLKNIETHLDDTNTGYLIATRDSLNCVQDDFVYASKAENKKWVEHQFTEKELNDCWKDAEKYFFKYTETDFSQAIYSRQIVDKTIIKRVQKIQEEDRVQFLKNNLDKATLEHPIEFFSEYFYNGKAFYTCLGRKITVFDHINLQELRQTPYGLCDDKGVIVGNVYIPTTPSKFKKHQKNEALYYSSAETVYNWKMEPFPDSDGSSFKMLNECVAEDKSYIYFRAIQLPKTQVGDYQINDTGYHTILYSKLQVRTLKKVFTEIDAATFEIISTDVRAFMKANFPDEPLRRDVFIMHCRDKDGEFVIHDYDINNVATAMKNRREVNLQVERITSLEEYIAKTHTLLQEYKIKKEEVYYPDYKNGKEEDYYTKMNQWVAENFEEKYKDWRFNSSFFVALNKYFYSCFQLYLKSIDTSYLQAGVNLFEKVAVDCFVNPYIFHNTACIYAALGNTEKAVQSVSAAVYYGYEKIELIWNDNDLKNIFNHPDFVALKNYYEQAKAAFPIINIPIIEKIEGMPEDSEKQNMAGKVLNGFLVPDTSLFDTHENEEHKAHYALLKSKVTWLMNYALQHYNMYYYEKCYTQFKDDTRLAAKTHFFALPYFFRKAHDRLKIDIPFCLSIVEKIKALLVQHSEEEETKSLVEEIRANDINRIFKIV